MYHVETFFYSGKHQIQFKNLSPDSKLDIQRNGIRVYMFCDGYIDTFISALNTVMAFLGGIGTNPYLPYIGSHVPEYMEKINVKFLNETMGYELKERKIQEYDYDSNLI